MAGLGSRPSISLSPTNQTVIVDLSEDDISDEELAVIPSAHLAQHLESVNGALHSRSQSSDNKTLVTDAGSGINTESDDSDDDTDSDTDSIGTITSDIMAAAEDPQFECDDSEVCTEEEGKFYRQRVREIGLNALVYETVSAGKITAKKLCTAFGVRLPAIWKDEPDQRYYRMLGKAIMRELAARQKLPQFNTIDDAVVLLQRSKKIMVITGAGISTNLGIPDFRSKATGFYAQMRAAGFTSPEEVFDIHVFDEDPTIFYTYAVDTFPKGDVFSPTHAFIRLLQDRQKLLTNFTQNIDNLEEIAGIQPNKLIQCHGSWATATCRKCQQTVRIEMIAAQIRSKEIPQCKQCLDSMARMSRPSLKRKRKRVSGSNLKSNKSRRNSWEDSDEEDDIYNLPEPGIMKPDITFFGEALPKAFFDRIQNHDREVVDLVIIIGTSMQVAPVSEIPRAVPATVPQIYISRDPCPHINFDITLLGDCDVITAELARRAEWPFKHAMLPRDRRVTIAPHEEGFEATWRVTPYIET